MKMMRQKQSRVEIHVNNLENSLKNLAFIVAGSFLGAWKRGCRLLPKAAFACVFASRRALWCQDIHPPNATQACPTKPPKPYSYGLSIACPLGLALPRVVFSFTDLGACKDGWRRPNAGLIEG